MDHRVVLFAALLLNEGCDRGVNPLPAGDPQLVVAEMTDAARTLLEGIEPPSERTDAAGDATTAVVLRDAAAEAGVDFTSLTQAERGRKLMPETTAGAGGWLDYDGDGWADLYLGQGGDAAYGRLEDLPRDRLYRNGRAGAFAEVTSQAALPTTGFAHGPAAADYDGDGFPDLYVANVGPDALLRNLGDGTFGEVTREAGIDNPLWSAGAAWGDVTGDGVLDVYVCNYVDYDPRDPVPCADPDGRAIACDPRVVPPVPNRLYVGRGDGTFRDASDAVAVPGDEGRSLCAVVADLTGDARPDIYVANDTTANHLFESRGDGTFAETGTARGLAGSGLGRYQASMGIAYADLDADARLDLYVTHFTDDSNTLYLAAEGGFLDGTRAAGLHGPTLPTLGFGTVATDFDADGTPELFVANGHIDDWRYLYGDPYRMRPQLFEKSGGSWQDVSAAAGPYFRRELLGRAVATADYDRDGRPDVLVVHQNSPAAVLHNESPSGHWLIVEPVGTAAPRTPVGTRVVVRQGDAVRVAELAGGTSYAACHEPVLHFGLGDDADDCTLEVTWPGGATETFAGVPVDRRLKIVEGRGGPRVD